MAKMAQAHADKCKALGCPDDVQKKLEAAALPVGVLTLIFAMVEQFGPIAWNIVKDWLGKQTPPAP